MLYRIIFFIFLCIGSGNLYAKTHIHPVPTLPNDISSLTVTDVFGISVVYQIHETLFECQANLAKPNLIKDFSVSKDQKEYIFKLKDLSFHDGRILSSEDVKYTLELVIRKKLPGFEKLSYIQGYEQFVSGDRPEMTGIQIVDSKKFKINLVQPSPRFVMHLCEFRFSILSKDNDQNIGLGPFRLVSRGKDKIVLNRVEPQKNKINELIYIERSKIQALKLLKDGLVDDLISYPILEKEALDLISTKNVQKVHIPRTYITAYNSATLKDKSFRNLLMNLFDKKKFLNECYEGNGPTDSMIPPGFLGFVDDFKGNSAEKFRGSFNSKKLNIGVAIGVGSESCVVKYLESIYGEYANVRQVDTDTLLKGWTNKKFDVIFLYFESENTLDFFQYFKPNQAFNMGLQADRKIEQMIGTYNNSADPKILNKLAVDMSYHILNNKTVLPIFHPKQFFVYSKKYKRITFGVKSVSFVDFSEMEYK